MYRDNLEVRSEDGINFLLTHCALGDAISSLPAICWARKMHTLDIRMTVWAARHMLPLFEHLIGGPGLQFAALDDFQMVRKQGDDKYAGACVINATPKGQITRNRHDMVEYAFATLLDRQVDSIIEKNYPHWAPCGPRHASLAPSVPYVVVPVGATNDTCVFHPKVLQPVLEWLIDEDYVPVLTGAHNTHVHTTAPEPTLLVVRDKVADIDQDVLAHCADMRNRTDLLQLRDLCQYSQAVVGVDGGTLHLAGTTNARIVYGCTRVHPRHRGIVRHDELNWGLTHVTPRDLACSGCQSNWTLIFKHNFAECAYGDSLCVEKLHADDFIEALQNFGL